MVDVKAAVRLHQEIVQRIRTVYGIAEEDGDVFTDTIEGESDLNLVLTAVLREARLAGAMRDGLKKIRDDMNSRIKRLDNKETNLRDLVAWAMQEAGLPKIPAPDMTVTVRAGKPGYLYDENAIKDDFKKQVTTTVLDHDKIEAEIAEGRIPYGVTKTNPRPILTVRTK